MADRTLASFTEPSLKGQPATTVRVERMSSGQPGIMFIIDTSVNGSPITDQHSIVVPDGVAFLAPVVRWLGSGEVVKASRVSETLARCIEIGNEMTAIDKAILEARIGFTNQGNTRSDWYDTELFNALSNHRESLRAELLSINNNITKE